MKAAVVFELGRSPVYAEFAEPNVGEGEVLVHVSASALSNLAKGRAAGAHYSASGVVPFVGGVDGVGRLEDGRRVYFLLPKPPMGAMAQRTSVDIRQCIELPDDLDDGTAAAIANPGMSAWAALKERARFSAGESVLVNGATGAAGKLAIQIAKYMGAKKIVATGRNVEVLDSLRRLGAEATIPLGLDPDELDKALQTQFASGIDVVLDYLWGQSAERIILAAGRTTTPVRYVQIGSASGSEISLPGAALRSCPIELMGSGLGSVPADRLIASIRELLYATVPGQFEIAKQMVPFSLVESAWTSARDASRIVFEVS